MALLETLRWPLLIYRLQLFFPVAVGLFRDRAGLQDL
jgi:hypothetical protein